MTVFRVEIFFFAADVAGVTGFIPKLDLYAGRFFGIGDIEIVKPVFANIVPSGWEQNDAAIGQSGEVVLDAAAAERVIDTVFPRRAAQVGFGDVVISGAALEHVGGTAKNILGRERNRR